MWYTPIYNLYLIDSVHLDHRYKKAQVSSNFDRDRSFREKRRIDISRRGEVSNSFLTRKLELRKSSRLRNAKHTTYKIKEKAALSLRRHL